MKKLFTLFLLGCAAATANAQQFQIPNGDFEAEWVKCMQWTSTGENEVGTQPESWKASNVDAIIAKVTIATQIQDGENNAVKLTNTEKFNNSIPAYLTFGTPWSTAKGITGSKQPRVLLAVIPMEAHSEAWSLKLIPMPSVSVINATTPMELLNERQPLHICGMVLGRKKMCLVILQ